MFKLLHDGFLSLVTERALNKLDEHLCYVRRSLSHDSTTGHHYMQGFGGHQGSRVYETHINILVGFDKALLARLVSLAHGSSLLMAPAAILLTEPRVTVT